MDNICAVLGCTRQDIRDIVPIKAGLTNLSFRFDVDGSPYVYRHPGVGTDAIINRESETFSQEAARDLGIDGTYLYEHPQEGWKLSRYLDDCEPFDLRNWDHVERAMEIGRTLHRSCLLYTSHARKQHLGREHQHVDCDEGCLLYTSRCV